MRKGGGGPLAAEGEEIAAEAVHHSILGHTDLQIRCPKKSFELIGWETKDIYQNLVQTFISDIKTNIKVEEKIFSIQRYIN